MQTLSVSGVDYGQDHELDTYGEGHPARCILTPDIAVHLKHRYYTVINTYSITTKLELSAVKHLNNMRKDLRSTVGQTT